MYQKLDSLAQSYDAELKKIIFNQYDLVQRLRFLQQINPQAYLSAGVIRNTVWSALHKQSYEIAKTEIDVIFFDQNENDQELTLDISRKLEQQFTDNEWDVVNQATVHTWYKTGQGQTILPHASLRDALSTWPETATAIAVRLSGNNELEIIAPFGLNDLFELKLRWNDRLVSRDVFVERVQAKQFLERWEKLVIVDC